ncbi:MAG TPA: YfiR family protein [Puia sp.]|nr:YfiR family protein [Puia sp.]
MSRGFTYSAILTLLLLSGFRQAGAAQDEEVETNLKAAFLYNFTKYIDWQLESGNGEFVIGVIGSSAVEPALEEIARTGTVDGRKITIRHIDRPDQIGGCQLLFIAHRRHLGLQEILSRVTRGEIAVAEENGAARNGAGFNFVRSGDKLRFEANIGALAASGLKVSSQLLKLAILVKQ